MSDRTDLVERLTELVGPSLHVNDLGDGWPSLADFTIGDLTMPIALFVSRVGLSHRGRDDIERRFQNPANSRRMPITRDRLAVLVGVWEGDELIRPQAPILVLADAYRRADHVTRWSAFVSVGALEDADRAGWAEQINNRDELIRGVRPELFGLAVTALDVGVDPDPASLRSIQTAGLLESPSSRPAFDENEVRLRRTVSVLVRETRFRGEVLGNYHNRCAMCGLGLGLVQGAHIYPASAPGSTDSPSNGVALCANHHLAFDRHQVAVLPEGLRIVFRPDVEERAADDDSIARFLSSTFDSLRPSRGVPLDPQALRRRHQFYAEYYDWLPI